MPRRKQSTAELERKGAFKHNPSRRNPSEPATPVGEPPMPLSLDEVGQEKWRWLVQMFRKMGTLDLAYADQMEVYCHTYSMYRRFMAEIQGRGVMEEPSGRGRPPKNPAFVEVHKYAERLLKMQAEMGLTPAGRSKIHVDKQETEDPMLRLLSDRAS